MARAAAWLIRMLLESSSGHAEYGVLCDLICLVGPLDLSEPCTMRPIMSSERAKLSFGQCKMGSHAISRSSPRTALTPAQLRLRLS